jgi:hypothetical protein
MITSNPFDGGKLTMKAMDTLSHGLSRIGNSCNNLTYFLWVFDFVGKSSKSSGIFLHRFSN